MNFSKEGKEKRNFNELAYTNKSDAISSKKDYR